MVAHGKVLKASRIAEWSDHYVNYEKTTKSLGKVTKAVHQKLKEMAERGSHDAPSDAVCFRAYRLHDSQGLWVQFPAEKSHTRLYLQDFPEHQIFVNTVVTEVKKATGIRAS